MRRSKEYEDARKEINRRAVEIANQKIRVLKLNEITTNALSKAVSSWLARYWNPFDVDYEFGSGFGMRMNITDPTVRKIMADEQLYEIAQQVVVEATAEALGEASESAPLITAILSEIILEGRHFE